MKLFVCSSVETSDDDEEEEVSEEEPQVDSDEGEIEDGDEADSDETNAEEGDENDENDSGAKNTIGRQINKNSGDSEASSSSEAETSFKGVNGEQKINGIKEEQPVKPPEFNVSKSPSKMKYVANGVSLPARLKNVSTEIMVLTAIRSLSERGGSSVIAIKKYIMNNYPQLDGPRTLKLIKNFIKKALVSGKLVQSKGTGLGGSFKVSPGTNRLEEQKQRQNRKKLVKKLKGDGAADKVKKNSKAAIKSNEKGEIKPATMRKNAKAKVSKSALKVKDGSESTMTMPKLSAALENALKASDSKPAKKAAKVKDAKEASPANGNPAKKTKVTKQNGTENADSASKKTSKKTKSAPAVTVQEKAKPAMSTKKKATAKSKNTLQDIDMGAGDAGDAKPKKKTAGKKVKAK